MSGGKKDSPKPPNYTAAANAQADSSQQAQNAATYANRPDQFTPFGSSQWYPGLTTDPATGKPVTSWQQSVSLDPTMQAALDAQNQLTLKRTQIAGGLADTAGQELTAPVDWAGLSPTGAAPTPGNYSTEGLNPYGMGPGDPNAFRQQATNAVYNQMKSRLDPQFQQQQSDMDISLRNQGLKPGDEAYDRAMGNFNRGRNDAYSTAMNTSITEGGNQAAQQYGMGIQGAGLANATRAQQLAEMLSSGGQRFGEQTSVANYQNQLRQQQIAEALQKQGWSLNAINAATSGQQVGMPNMPSFTGAGASQGAQLLPAAALQYNSNLQGANANQMNQQGMLTGGLDIFRQLFGFG